MKSIFAGPDSSAVLYEDGSLYLWGKNAHGTLGLDDDADRFAPQLLHTIQGGGEAV